MNLFMVYIHTIYLNICKDFSLAGILYLICQHFESEMVIAWPW